MDKQNSLEVDSPSVTNREQSSSFDMVKAIGFGAILGLTWGASMRAWMVVLALEFGDYPRFTWDGTFMMILLPSALMGMMLGGSRYASITQGREHWRWAALSPLLLIMGPLLFMRDFIPTLLEDGLGGGAIAIALIGVFGGYGLSPHRWRWLKGFALLSALGMSLATPYALFFSEQIGDASLTPRQIFGALYFVLLTILLIVAVRLPYRVQTN